MKSNQWTVKKLVESLMGVEKRIFKTDTEFLEVWYDIRFEIFKILSRELKLYGRIHRKAPNKNNKIITKGCYLLKYIVTWFNNNPLLYIVNKKPYLFFGSSRRKLLEDGKYWDIYTDFITNNILNNKTLTIEKPYEGSHFNPVPCNNLAYLEKINVFKRRYHKNKDKELSGILLLLEKIEKEIENVFGIKVPVKDLGLKRYINNKRSQAVFVLLLKILKPKLFFIVCSYGKEYMIRAAKELKIPTIELQHGVITKYHLGYNFDRNLTKKSFPDYFFSFGEYWNNSADLPIPEGNIYAIGYPFLEEKYTNLKNNVKKKQIVFISQGTIGEKLSKLAIDLSEKYSNQINILYKLHPGEYVMWKTEYPSLNQANNNGKLTVISGHSPDLYTILSESAIQVGVNSTALYEGAFFGCKTYLLNSPGIEHMENFISSGYATVIESAEDIDIDKKIITKDFGNIFSSGWRSNIIKAIKLIEKN